jgi:RNA polymerase sigma-70 factor, ECF subfamily
VLRRDEKGVVLRAEGKARLLWAVRQRQKGVLRMNEGGATAKLATELSRPLRAFVARRVPSDIDPNDVLQEVLLRVHQRLPSLLDTERLDAWIFQITRNTIADAMRLRRRQHGESHADEADYLESGDLAEDTRSAEKELSPCMTPMIARLKEPYRTAMQLTEIRGMTQAAAAAHEAISTSGMRSRVQRGREQIKALLLECCHIDVDVRGGIVDYERRPSHSSLCGPCNPAAKCR